VTFQRNIEIGVTYDRWSLNTGLINIKFTVKGFFFYKGHISEVVTKAGVTVFTCQNIIMLFTFQLTLCL